MLFLAGAEGHLDLGATGFEIEFDGDEGHALLQLADQSVDLALMHEQFALAGGGVVLHTRGRVFTDVAVHQPELALVQHAVGIAQVRLARAQRFDLAAGQDHSGLKLIA